VQGAILSVRVSLPSTNSPNSSQGSRHPLITDTYTYLDYTQGSIGRRVRRKKRSTEPTEGGAAKYRTENGRDSDRSKKSIPAPTRVPTSEPSASTINKAK